MADDVKDSRGLRDQVIKSFFSAIKSNGDDPKIDVRTAKDLIGTLASWAGKGKDEIVGVICREIGVAVAAMLKEPLTQVLENRKVQISIELIPKVKADVGPSVAGKKKRPTKGGTT